jgi:hypothetical protein
VDPANQIKQVNKSAASKGIEHVRWTAFTRGGSFISDYWMHGQRDK